MLALFEVLSFKGWLDIRDVLKIRLGIVSSSFYVVSCGVCRLLVCVVVVYAGVCCPLVCVTRVCVLFTLVCVYVSVCRLLCFVYPGVCLPWCVFTLVCVALMCVAP